MTSFLNQTKEKRQIIVCQRLLLTRNRRCQKTFFLQFCKRRLVGCVLHYYQLKKSIFKQEISRRFFILFKQKKESLFSVVANELLTSIEWQNAKKKKKHDSRVKMSTSRKFSCSAYILQHVSRSLFLWADFMDFFLLFRTV